MTEKQGYWYLCTYYVCVLCGRTETYKERVYDRPKPKQYAKRHIYNEELCGNHY